MQQPQMMSKTRTTHHCQLSSKPSPTDDNGSDKDDKMNISANTPSDKANISSKSKVSPDDRSSPASDQQSSADIQAEINQLMLQSDQDNKSILGFTPSNFDEKQLPVPAFTAIIILGASLYLIGYGFYVGLMGFPDGGSGLPRPL
jgi:hypothetical protein